MGFRNGRQGNQNFWQPSDRGGSSNHCSPTKRQGPENGWPFAETKEWIAGFVVLECAGLDEAVEVAAKHPMARFGKIEIRPFSLAD